VDLLRAFVNLTEAQADKKIPPAGAAALITTAQQVISLLERG
jgi:hypothetical protein